MSRIIHLIPDEKFSCSAIRDFNRVYNNNFYIVYTDSKKKTSINYVNPDEVNFMNKSRILSVLLNGDYSSVIFHSLNGRYIPLIKFIPNNKKLVWIGWGYDYYGNLITSKIYNQPLEKTLTLKKSNQKTLGGRIKHLKQLLGNTLGYSDFPKTEKLIFNRVNYFIPVLDIEYYMIKSTNQWFKPSYIPWNYGNVEEDLDPDGTLGVGECLGNDILIGNSASYSNNHLDIFEILQNIQIIDGKLITPLSYGDREYSDQIANKGYSIFKEKFVPLKDFLKKEDYLKILKRCGFAIMNHTRQQAIHNIAIMMLLGAKLYLNKSNPAYEWLLKNNCVVFSIDELKETGQLIPLRPLEIEKNRLFAKRK